MNYTPIPNKKPAYALSLLLTLTSLSFAMFSILAEGTAARLFGVSAIVAFAASTPIITRYLLCSHTYFLGENELSVVRQTAKGQKILCRLSYADMVSITPLKESKKQAADLQKYNYCSSMLPKNALCIFCKNDDGDFALILEGDGELEKGLARRMTPDYLS